ncbi:MAG: 16S rRNA (adenine(1518)-N(6)/adenine(1519)-N(6))-dimethyltransferase RsmA [Pseudomonadota bacterium]|nr:16S rRNA (adenine(1518)-N(6)/adenine(1519)-N(6))-dimethyltransferase RsmA [Pseudomonadota bacterium]
MLDDNNHNNRYKKNLELSGINPSKKLGQNFIFDKNILNKITSLINPDACDLVIEIGPGLGGLSEALLNNNVKKILLVEKDRQFTQLLNALKLKYPDQIDIIFEDAINFNFDIENYKNITIISNLPYNVATKILTTLINAHYSTNKLKNMVLMFQKEVAQRITANYNDKHYGRLSIISQYLYQCNVEFDLNPAVFYPKPMVDSSIVSFKSLERKSGPDIKMLESITRAAFSQRRKKIRTSLKNIISETDLAERLNIDVNLRAEQLSVNEYLKISEYLEKLS